MFINQNRRTFLRGVGAMLALPSLESFGARQKEVVIGHPNNRLAYIYFPNGSAAGSWKPRKVSRDGKILQLNQWMEPLEKHKSDLIVTGKLWTPRGNGHGAGTATWLTGGSYNGHKNDAGGISADQLVAKHFEDTTPLPSLELSTSGEGSFSGSLPRNCLSWVERNIPAARETVPRAVFDKLFRRAEEGFMNRSVIDLVNDQSKSLKRRASAADGQKIDEYLEAVRSIERRFEFAEKNSQKLAADRALTDTLNRPEPGIPSDHEEYVRQMLELMALSFWSGATKVSSFMLDHGQSNRYFNFIPGVKGTWHALSHWKDSSGKTEDDDGITSWNNMGSKKQMYNAVTRWHHAQLAWFLTRLKELKDSDGVSVLDRSMIMYGSSIADGHTHYERDLPILLAGGGSGLLKTGNYIRPSRDTSMSKVHFSLLKRMGLPIDRFAEAKEELPGI